MYLLFYNYAKPCIGTSPKYFLSVDFEKNPLNSEAEYGLNVTSESVEMVYHEVGFNFFFYNDNNIIIN